MKTVLIITASFDPQADLLIAELRRRSVPCVRWNTYEFPLSSLLTYRASNSGFGAEIISDGRTIDLASIGSIWWQWDEPAGFPAGLNTAERRFAEREAELAVNALPAIGQFAWINHPTCERLANSKAGQLFAARTVGLEIPRTVITNNPDEVRAFIATAPGQIVYKASSPPRNIAADKALFTGLVTDETLANLDLTPDYARNFSRAHRQVVRIAHHRHRRPYLCRQDRFPSARRDAARLAPRSTQRRLRAGNAAARNCNEDHCVHGTPWSRLRRV
jgi:hypothetical protein